MLTKSIIIVPGSVKFKRSEASVGKLVAHLRAVSRTWVLILEWKNYFFIMIFQLLAKRFMILEDQCNSAEVNQIC